MEQQRGVEAGENELAFEGRGVIAAVAGDAVIAVEDEEGVVVPGLLPGQAHELADAVIHEAEGIVFLLVEEAGRLVDGGIVVFEFEAAVILGNGVGPVVARGLDDGEEGLAAFVQGRGGLAEQIQIGDAPHVDAGRGITALLVDVQAGNIVLQQATDVAPVGAAAKEVELFIAGEGVDQGVLADHKRIAAGGLAGLHVGDAGDGGPDRAGGAGVGRIVAGEGDRFTGDGVEVRGWIQRIAEQAGLVAGEGLEEHHDDVGPLRGQRAGLLDDAPEVEPGLVRPGDAEPSGQAIVVPAHRGLVVAHLAVLQGVGEVENGVHGHRRGEGVGGGESLGPAQRIPGELAVQAEDHQYEGQGDGDGLAPAAQVRVGIGGGTPQQVMQHGHVAGDEQRQPQQDPDHGIGFPDHLQRGGPVVGEAQHRGVHRRVQIGEVAEVHEIEQQQHGHRHGQVAEPEIALPS